MAKRIAAACFLLALTIVSRSTEAITVAGPNPNDSMYLAPAGGPFDGVARLIINGSIGCSGSLLSTGFHVVTAGHCITGKFGDPLPGSLTATFVTPSGPTTLNGAAYNVFPLWDGDLFSGTDLALVTLDGLAPLDAQRYDIYRAFDEPGKVGKLAGFGTSGTGNDGAVLPFGTRRHGMNLYDVAGDFFSNVSGNILMGDFDNGLAINDGFAVFGRPNLGLGLSEVMVSFGDSGGPTFLGGRVAGVHSFLASIGCPPDVLTPSFVPNPACQIDASFGEFFGDSRVSRFQDFIDRVLVPEPGSLILFAAGFVGLLEYSRRRKRA